MIYVNFMISLKCGFESLMNSQRKPHVLKTDLAVSRFRNQTASFTFCANSQCHSWHRIIADSNRNIFKLPSSFYSHLFGVRMNFHFALQNVLDSVLSSRGWMWIVRELLVERLS